MFGKAVGGGLPLAGVAARAGADGAVAAGRTRHDLRRQSPRLRGGPGSLEVIEREGLVERAACLGETIKARLRPLVGQYGVVDVRGNGLMIGIELRDANGKPDYARCEAVKLIARENGLLLLTCGAKIGSPYADNAAIRLIPPLNTPDEIAHKAVDILIDALRQVA